jgi:putative ABC transport system ATP-binding protein
MQTDAPIRVTGLNHWFGSGEARKQAIFDVDLEVARGSLTILMGPSGSGKTTVLTLMGCLRDVQEGSVRLLGTELNGAGTGRRWRCAGGSASSSRRTTCTPASPRGRTC